MPRQRPLHVQVQIPGTETVDDIIDDMTFVGETPKLDVVLGLMSERLIKISLSKSFKKD